MEPIDQHSKNIYDDPYCFINHKGELWLKANSLTAEKKIADLDIETSSESSGGTEPGTGSDTNTGRETDSRTGALKVTPDIDALLQGYRNAFDDLSRQAQATVSEATSPDELDRLAAELADAPAIGDFDTLARLIEKARQDLARAESTAEPSAAPETAAESSQVTAEENEAELPEPEPEPEPEPVSESEAKPQSEAESDSEPGKPVETTSDTEVESSDAEQYYLDLVGKAEEYARLEDWAHVPQLFGILYDSWNEGPVLDATRINELKARVDAALQAFNQRRSEHYEHLKDKRQKNFDTRVALLERLQKILDQKRWQATGEVASIRRKWDDLRQLPSGTPVEEQNNTFNALMDTFDTNRVEFLVKAREKEEENLIGKLVILEKMQEAAAKAGPGTENWDQLDKELEELTRQWRRIKHVPKEKEDEVWNRFKSVRDGYFLAKSEHDETYKKEIEKNIRIRQRLIRKAVALTEDKDLAKGIRTINRLHSEWKKTGPVPKELNDQLWEEFKTASDTFNQIKIDNMDLIREQETENYNRKVELCEKAESLSTADNWKKAADEMTHLLEQWKKIGPVPRKKTNAIWNRFRTAMDEFYKKRREYFKESRVDQKDNLDKKKEVIEKILALAVADDTSEVIEKVKPLQEEFKSIGFVPIKQKNAIWVEYKAALDKVYGKARSTNRGAGRDRGGHDRGGRARQMSADSGDRKSQQEIFRLRRECDELRDTINRYNDTMTYIKPNKKGLELRQEIQNSIDQAEKTLQEKLRKIEELSSGEQA